VHERIWTIAGAVNIISYQSKSSVRAVSATGVFTLKPVSLCFYLHTVITTPHNIASVLILFTSPICFKLEDGYFRHMSETCFNYEINGKTLKFMQKI